MPGRAVPRAVRPRPPLGPRTLAGATSPRQRGVIRPIEEWRRMPVNPSKREKEHAAALEKTIDAVAYEETPLGDVLTFYKDLLGGDLNIIIDHDVLDRLHFDHGPVFFQSDRRRSHITADLE